MKTQTELVLDHLRRWGSVTPMEALTAHGIMRLGARIHDLRQEGHVIVTERLEVDTRGARGQRKAVARYRMQHGG